MFEIGSKNTFDVGGRSLILNASAYYSKYTDQVFSTVVGTELLDSDPSNDTGCLDSDPNTVCSNVTLNQNVAEASNIGMQLDAAYQLGNGFNIGGTLLWQDTEYKDGSIVSDGRRPSPAGGALLVDLGGNELPAHAAVDAQPAPRPGHTRLPPARSTGPRRRPTRARIS